MYIKTQDNRRIINMANVVDLDIQVVCGTAILVADTVTSRMVALGEYRSAERCEDILAEIETELRNECYTNDVYDHAASANVPRMVGNIAFYHMPKK